MFRFLLSAILALVTASQASAVEYWIPESPSHSRPPASGGCRHHWPATSPRNCRQVIVITPARREIGPWRHVGYWPDGEPLYQRTIREWPETRELKWLCDREIGNPVRILEE